VAGGVPGVDRPRQLSLTDLALHENPSGGAGAPRGRNPEDIQSTPTPTQFFFPKKVTEEQEDFSRGFSQALEEIYRSKGVGVGSTETPSNSNTESLNIPETLGSGKWVEGAPVSSDLRLSQTLGNHRAETLPVTEILAASEAQMFYSSNSSTAAGTNFNAYMGQGSSKNTRQEQFMNMPPVATAAHTLAGNSGNIRQMDQDVYAPMQQGSGGNGPTTYHMLSSAHGAHQAYQGTSHGLPPHMNPANYSNIGYDDQRLTGTPNFNDSFGPSAPSSLHTFGTTNNPSSYIHTVKTEPDMAACSPFSSAGSPFSGAGSPFSAAGSSVNLADQERMKLERKRAKNRIAAQKCQMRKVEKISRLEDKVSKLHDQNTSLAQTVAALNKHIAELRRQIIAHANHGCRLMVPNLPSGNSGLGQFQ